MPDVDLTPDLKAPETDMPEELKEQQAKGDSETKRKTLEKRIRELKRHSVGTGKDGKKLSLLDLAREYERTGEIWGLHARLGVDPEEVQAAITKRDGDPYLEPFWSIMAGISKIHGRGRLLVIEELAFKHVEELAQQKEGNNEFYNLKDYQAAIKLCHQILSPEGIASPKESEPEDSGWYPDNLNGHLSPGPEDEEGEDDAS